MKVKLFQFIVMRSIDFHIPVAVPEYEAEILQSIHGEERVTRQSENHIGVFEVDSIDTERERLRMKYGLKDKDNFWVDYLFKRQSELEEAVNLAEYIEPKGSEQTPYSANTRDELKAILDGMLIKYPANASKEQLIALVEANAPAV